MPPPSSRRYHNHSALTYLYATELGFGHDASSPFCRPITSSIMPHLDRAQDEPVGCVGHASAPRQEGWGHDRDP